MSNFLSSVLVLVVIVSTGANVFASDGKSVWALKKDLNLYCWISKNASMFAFSRRVQLHYVGSQKIGSIDGYDLFVESRDGEFGPRRPSTMITLSAQDQAGNTSSSTAGLESANSFVELSLGKLNTTMFKGETVVSPAASVDCQLASDSDEKAPVVDQAEPIPREVK